MLRENRLSRNYDLKRKINSLLLSQIYNAVFCFHPYLEIFY